jgi:hypothetical protein
MFCFLISHRYSEQVKRIVITSSVVAAVTVGKPITSIVNEESWNEYAVNKVKEEGRNAGNLEKYEASKTLAEQGKYDSLGYFWSPLTLHIATSRLEFLQGQ